jgi:uncharacterized membrane protein
MTAIFNYLVPKPITPLTQEEEKMHFEDLSYLLVASVAANIFFAVIISNPYTRALRFGIVFTSAFLFCELEDQRKASKGIDKRLITISYLHLSVSKAFLCMAQAFQYFFVYGSVSVICEVNKVCEQVFKHRTLSRRIVTGLYYARKSPKIMSGGYALYYLRKSLKCGLEYKRLLVKC